jgi:ribonuclease P protein component|tara:strand:+ start:261 stop:518 length:258 start_codon:yes stop_codon:yes gene_type:complete
LLAGSNGLAHTRIGFVASKSVGGAVQRNRAKRRLRAELRAQSARLDPGWDLVFVARRPILNCSMPTLSAAVTELLSRAGLLQSEL